MIRHDRQPCAWFNLKSVALLVADPNRLGTTGKQIMDRVGSSDVSQAVAQRFGGDGAKLLIGDRFVDAQVQQFFRLKGDLQD